LKLFKVKGIFRNSGPASDPGASFPTRTEANNPNEETKELQRQYGDQLVCVRYRYDAKRQKRMKTIELLVEENDHIPNDSPALSAQVLLHVGYQETELRARVKAAGGAWDPAEKAWKLSWVDSRDVLE
jgi:hypothetical protein